MVDKRTKNILLYIKLKNCWLFQYLLEFECSEWVTEHITIDQICSHVLVNNNPFQ